MSSVTENQKTVQLFRESYLAPGKTRRVEQTVTYPADCTLHWDASQQCLTVRDKGGQTLAAFVGLKRYRTDLVIVSDETVTEETR